MKRFSLHTPPLCRRVTRAAQVAAVAIALIPQTAAAQDLASWQFGFTEGYRYGMMSFSELSSPKHYDKNNGLSAPVASLWIQKEFGSERHFAVRPEVAYTRRGGTLTDFIVNKTTPMDYRLRADYIDARLSLIWNFGRADARLRPYVMVTPLAGFVADGTVGMELAQLDAKGEPTGLYSGYRTDLSDANMSKTYLAVAPGAGVKWQFHVGSQAQHLFTFGIEACYEIGLTDTYGSKEKDGVANDVLGRAHYNIAGSRKLSGFEVKAVLGIPFTVFKKTRRSSYVAPQPAPEPVVVREPEPEPVRENPCYSIEEILDLINNGQDVRGKTICAINDAINFDFNKSAIKPESFDYLNRLADVLTRIGTKVKVNGHTDNVGNVAYNLRLSRDRAAAVVKYLKGRGVPANLLTYDFFGSSHPLTTNDTEEGRRMNRRVEFQLLR